MLGQIQKYDDHNPMFYIEIGGHGYQFSVGGFPKDKHNWLVDVLSRAMTDIHNRATYAERKRLQLALKGLLGVKESV